MGIDCAIRQNEDGIILLIKGHKTLDGKDITKFTDFFNSYLTGESPFKTLFDLRKVESPPKDAITPLLMYMTSIEEVAKDKVIGSSVLVSNGAIESMINLLFTLRKPQTPTKVTTDINEACLFLNSL